MKLFRILAVTALALFLPFAATACELATDVAAIATDDFDVLDTTRGTGDIDAKKEKAYTDAGIKCIMGSSSIPATTGS